MDCGRTCNLAAANAVVRGVAPVGARIIENGSPADMGTWWLAGASGIVLHGEYADRDDAVVVGVGRGPDGKPAVFGLRTKGGRETTEAELLVARDGEASLFPPTTPVARNALFDGILERSQRTSPEAMLAVVNAYFDGIETANGSAVSVTDTCNRVENGVQTTHSARFGNLACNSLEVFTYIPDVRERRFPVVDVEHGVVVAAVAFYIPGGDYKRMVNGVETARHYEPRSVFLFEAFKIVDGRIVQIEATMRNMPLGTKMDG